MDRLPKHKMTNTIESQKQYQISLTLDDRCLLVQGVTKWTTCSDVIEMVLKKFPFYTKKRGAPSLKIFESSRGEEKILSGRKKILNVMRAWNSSKHGEFVMRRISVVQRNQTSEAKRKKIERMEPEGSEAGYKCNSTTQNRAAYSNSHLQKITPRGIQERNSSIAHGNYLESSKDVHFVNNTELGSNSCASRGNSGPVKNSDFDTGCLSICGADMSRNVTGRSTAMANFIDSSNTSTNMFTNKVRYAVKKNLKSRNTEQGKGKTSDVSYNGNKTLTKYVDNHQELAHSIHKEIASMDQKEGKEAILDKYFADYLRYQSPTLPSTYRRRGDGAESSRDGDSFRHGDGSSFSSYHTNSPVNSPHYNSLCSDICSDIFSDSGHGDNEFDVAFIDGTNDEYSKHETGFIDDEECVKRLVDYSLTESDISDIECDSEHELSRISSVSDFVKSVFTDNSGENEDDELDSFMKTKLSDEISDEGLSSLGSDFET